MSAATFTPGPSQRGPAAHGATAFSPVHHHHRVGDALRAVKVFVGAAFGVVLLGEYEEEAGVRRR
ncbi:hypothetical protein HEP87_25080 [Streptomyces sp. S1D4-11]|jgi:hypothetical protein|nr:hypothetical protein [Streptomyces sp. S1D4-11]QIY96686.1 hypothetical protein HEP87_25080 [Streptomyces sp. S1D4-11]